LKQKLRTYQSKEFEDKRIVTFLEKVDSNAVFQSKQFYELIKKFKKHKPFLFLTENKNKNIVGLLLAIIHKESTGLFSVFSSRSIIIGGPIVLNNNLQILDLLLKKYNKFIKYKVIYSQFRNTRDFSFDEKNIFNKNGYIYKQHLDIFHDLTLPVEDQWMKIHKGRRKNIRRSIKSGLMFKEIKNDIEFKKSYHLIKETYKRVKLPILYNSIFFDSYDYLTKNGILKVFVAVLDDEIVGTRMVLCYNGLIYDWIAGASEIHLNKYPNDFLPWKVMEWGSKNNYKYFDFGGAGKPNVPYGVRDHKLKFGGELVEHGRFENIHNNFLFQVGKMGLRLYKRII